MTDPLDDQRIDFVRNLDGRDFPNLSVSAARIIDELCEDTRELRPSDRWVIDKLMKEAQERKRRAGRR